MWDCSLDPKIIQVNWCLTKSNIFKYDTYGIVKGDSRHETCWGIFYGSISEFVICFSTYMSVSSTLHNELEVAIIAINMLLSQLGLHFGCNVTLRSWWTLFIMIILFSWLFGLVVILTWRFGPIFIFIILIFTGKIMSMLID